MENNAEVLYPHRFSVDLSVLDYKMEEGGVELSSRPRMSFLSAQVRSVLLLNKISLSGISFIL